MPLAPGTRLGPYEIVSSLGAGGMGEVWRARDTRLGREVAVKVLATHLTAQPEVRARFEREARAISSLNHPHICVLHDVGRVGDTDYLVMELVEGETLARRLKRGPLPVPEALRIGAQIADALDRAHRSGIVHRDLKPGNVMLGKSGAKLMDFGLARAHDGAGPLRSGSSELSVSPTMSRPLTAEGSIVGTFQYMAPEQLEGGEADARSDVWSFGCVLYELVAGRPAFEGRSAASLISSIMKEEPRPLGESAATAQRELPPPELERLVRRCLAKDPDERWQSAADLKHELQWMSGVSRSESGARAAATAVGGAASRPASALGWWVGAAGVALAIAAFLWAGRAAHENGSARVIRFDVPEPRGARLLPPAEAALSPDGARLVFCGEDSTGAWHLYLRDLGSTDARELPGGTGGRLPFWSPDGRWIGFFAGASLFKMPVEGGPPVALCPAPDARGGAWSPRGVIVFAPEAEGPILRVSADGGDTKAVTTVDRAAGDRSHRYPQFLPDGRHFLYAAVRGGASHPWYVGDVDGGKSRLIAKETTAPVWSPTGHLLWFDKNRILARRFAPGSLKFSGDPAVVATGAFADNFAYPNVTAGGGGTLFYQRYRAGDVRLAWRSRDGSETPAFPDPLPVETDLSISHDGQHVVYSALQDGALDLWMQDLGGGPAVRVTSDGSYKANLLWSEDDRRLLYSRAMGRSGYEVRMLDLGSGIDTLVMKPSGSFAFATWWSPDGSRALFVATDTTGSADVWIVPTDGSGPPRVWRHTSPSEFAAALSPNQESILLYESAQGRNQIAVEPFPGPGARLEIPCAPLAGGQLTASGFYITEITGAIREIPMSWGPPVRFGTPRTVGQQETGINVANGVDRLGRVLIVRRQRDSRLSSLEGILDWPAALRRR